MTKHIFVTGGVASSLGKGLTASSLGMLLTARGLSVVMQKLDPYLNVDPGTMNPYQHGEVFVTDDGAECDLDVGHYERFLDRPLSGKANVTTGQVYSTVIEKERRGDYLGDTVQVIPHVTDEIASKILDMAEPGIDVVITEVGGTIGDIEGLPFLEAVRQVRHRVGKKNSAVVHVSLVPYMGAAGELKTKPTQHSVAAMRQAGLTPDALVIRSDREIPASVRSKLSLMCDVDEPAVISCTDSPSIYLIPRTIHAQGLDAYLVQLLGLPFRDVEWGSWGDLLDSVEAPEGETTIAIVGKYVGLHDAYLSVSEAINAACYANGVAPRIKWIEAEDIASEDDAHELLSEVDGIVVPGGFGERGIEGKIRALTYARENAVPALGICLGMQLMAIEAVRATGLTGAGSTENSNCEHPVVSTMAEQLGNLDGGNLGGTLRLGSFPSTLEEGSMTATAYGANNVSERHRHRYEVNPAYEAQMAESGLVVSGRSPSGDLIEFVEIPSHPFYVGTQAHPEFTSRPNRPNPLFKALVTAAVALDTTGDSDDTVDGVII